MLETVEADPQVSKSGLLGELGIDTGQIAGKAVLNVGSAGGDLCLAAMQAGAARAVGIDPSAERMELARKAVAGRPVELIESDFETWDDRGEGFDFVICSNVLHRMLDPVHALRRLMRLARETLVVEFSAPGVRDVRKNKVSPAALLGWGAGLIALAAPRYNTDLYNRTFLFTPDAIRTILSRHSVVFEPAIITRRNGVGRYLAVADRRKIRHLTVIAGPTASGKSTLYRHLDATMRGELGIPLEDSAHVTGSEASLLPKGRLDHVVLHYDLLRPFDNGLHSYERDIAADLFALADHVTFITLFASPARLRRQLSASEIESRRPGKRSPRHLRLLQLYGDPRFLAAWYERWQDYCRRFDAKSAGNFFVENHGAFKVRNASQERLPFSPDWPDEATERG